MSKDLEKRIEAIENRNKRVETDKKWETSWTRRILITDLTYIVAGIYMTWAEIKDPWVSALIPAGGYFLSTLGMKIAREIWENKA